MFSVDSFTIMKDMTVIALKYTPRNNEPEFIVHITPYPTWEQVANEYRNSPAMPDKKMLNFSIAMAKNNSQVAVIPQVVWPPYNADYFVTPEEEKRRLHGPSRIANPHYTSLTQGVYAGLSLARHEIIWPSQTQERVLQSTLDKYRSSLRMLNNAPCSHDNEYRIQEVIREAVLIFALDIVDAIELIDQLKISDRLKLRGKEVYQNLKKTARLLKTNYPDNYQNVFRQMLTQSPELLVQIAEMFDISSIASDTSPAHGTPQLSGQ